MMRSHNRARRPRHAQGFTLIEMMVALVAGAIAVVSVYYVGSAASRHFHEQQRVAQSQMSLRMAMEQIRRDFSRAGYLGTPNSAVEQACVAPATAIAAIRLFNSAGTAALTLGAVNGVTADRVVMTANYASSDYYLAIGVNSAGNQAFLQKTWQGFRRSFGDPIVAASYDDVFLTGRTLHFQTLQGNHFFPVITGASSGGLPSVSFAPALPVGSPCLGGLGDGALLAPLSTIEYVVLNVGTTASLSTLANAASPLAGVIGPALVRREITAAGLPLAGTERVVAEYVADFDVDFVLDTAAAVGDPPNLQFMNDGAAALALAAAAHHARSAIVRLSVRTAAEDPRFGFVARNPGDPLTRYELNALTPGAARVRTLTEEIVLPNIANRGIRP